MTDLVALLERAELHRELAGAATFRPMPFPDDADPEDLRGYVQVDRGPVLAVLGSERGLWFVGAVGPSARAGHVLRAGFASWDKVRAAASRRPGARVGGGRW